MKSLLFAATLAAAFLLLGCGDTAAKREDARILEEFRGRYFVPVAHRRPAPGSPPLVPHVVYNEDFRCLVCHAHKDFYFRGQPVPACTHPERKACLQCHIPLQSADEPFRFNTLGKGDFPGPPPAPAAATSKGKAL